MLSKTYYAGIIGLGLDTGGFPQRFYPYFLGLFCLSEPDSSKQISISINYILIHL